jgi:hypothetical protein
MATRLRELGVPRQVPLDLLAQIQRQRRADGIADSGERELQNFLWLDQGLAGHATYFCQQHELTFMLEVS